MKSENFQLQKNSLIITYKAEMILLFVTLTWGLSFPLIKISLESVSPLFFILLRFSFTLFLFIIFFRKNIDIREIRKLKYGVILGLFLFAGFVFQTIGLKYTTASNSAFITGSSILIVPFIQYLILKSKPRAENIFGVLIVISGLLILTDAFNSKLNSGDILTLLCSVSFAFELVLLDKFSAKVDFHYLVLGQFIAMVVLSGFFVYLFEILIFEDYFIYINPGLIILILITSVFSTFMGIFLMTKYQNKTTPVRACIIYNMEAVFAAVFAFILLGEVMNIKQITGASIMIAGFIVSEFYPLLKLKLSGEEKI